LDLLSGGMSAQQQHAPAQLLGVQQHAPAQPVGTIDIMSAEVPQQGGSLLDQLSSGGLGMGGAPLLVDDLMMDNSMSTGMVPNTGGYSPLADALYMPLASGSAYVPPSVGNSVYVGPAVGSQGASASAAAAGLGKGKSMRTMEKEGVNCLLPDDQQQQPAVKDEFSFIADVTKQQKTT
jgi:hypothetical protein